MREIIFILFLLSGTLKPFFIYFHIPMGIDFTVLCALLLIILLGRDIAANKFVININQFSKYAMTTLFFLFATILFSLFYTSSQSYVYSKILQFITILLAFTFPILSREFSVTKALKFFLYLAIITTIVFLPIFMNGYKLFLTDYAHFIRTPIALIYQSYLPIGYMIGIAILINMFFPFFSPTRKFLVTLFLLAALVTAGARGPLFSVITLLLMYAIIKKFNFKIPRWSTVLLSLLLVIPIGIYSLSKVNLEDLLTRTYTRIVTIQNEPSANDRLVRTKFVFDHIDAEHFTLGYGFGSFGFEYSKVDERSYPHNLLLELLFELGIVGLTIYLLFLWPIMRKLIISKSFVLWALFLYVFVNSLKSLSLSDSRILFGFLALILIYTPKLMPKPTIKEEKQKND